MTTRTFAETQFALRLLDARLELVRSLAQMRQCRLVMIERGHGDELARARYRSACERYQMAVEQAEREDDVLQFSDELNARLAQ
jgi:hypothetical protein